MKMPSARFESPLAATRLDDEHGDVEPCATPSTTDDGAGGEVLVAREVARLLAITIT